MAELGQLGPEGKIKSITVSQQELGYNCWLPARFLGGECDRQLQCDYPEKSTCKATVSELSITQRKTRERFLQDRRK